MITTYDGFGFPGGPDSNPQTPPRVVLWEYILPAAANRFPTIFINPNWLLNILLEIFVANYQGTDVIAAMYNGDTGPNYSDFAIIAAGLSSTQSGGALTATTISTISANKMRFGKPTNKWRCVRASIGNVPGKNKGMGAIVTLGSQTPPTVTPDVHLGVGGEWNNAVNPITQIDLLTDLGINMGAGSSAQILGWKSPAASQQ